MNPVPVFVDTSLRDGLQAPGIALSAADRCRLADQIIDAGFTELEAGIPVAGEADIRTLRHVRSRSVRAIGWCRALGADLEASERIGSGAVHIAFPTSRRLQDALGWDARHTCDRLEGLVARGCIGHEFVSVGFMDCFRSDIRELATLVRLALDSGAHRVRLADSVGLGTPEKVRGLAAGMDRQDLERLEFHGHDDLGLALANGLAALECGFGGLSGTVAGFGERAGNLAWERLAVVRKDSGRPFPDLRKLVEVAMEMYRLTDRAIPRRSPVIGADCRTHESGIHCAAHFRDAGAFMPWNPSDLGLEATRVVAGASSGRGGLTGMLREQGLEPDPILMPAFLEEVRRLAGGAQRSMDGIELVHLYRSFIKRSA